MSLTPPPYRPPGQPGWYDLTPPTELPDPPPGVHGWAAPPSPNPPPLPPAHGWFRRNAVAVTLAAIVVLLIGALAANPDQADVNTAAPPDAPAATFPPTTARPAATLPPRTTTTAAGLSDMEIQELALDLTWDKAPLSQREDICMGVTLFGAAEAAALMNEGAGGDFDESLIESKLIGWCY